MCRQNSFLESAVAVTSYNEQALIGRLLRAWKYQYAEELFVSLSRGMQQFFDCAKTKIQPCDMIVPVPLHPRRYAERGFNQSELLATKIGQLLQQEIVCALIRRRYTVSQATLGKTERKENIFEAFVLSKNISVEGKRIFLVDDIFTTGNTMQECARVLRDAGASEVRGFTFARG